MKFIFYLLLAYFAYKIIKVIVGFFFTTSFDLKNKNSGFNFSSRSPKSNKNRPPSNPSNNNSIEKKDIIDAEFEEIKENEENSK